MSVLAKQAALHLFCCQVCIRNRMLHLAETLAAVFADCSLFAPVGVTVVPVRSVGDQLVRRLQRVKLFRVRSDRARVYSLSWQVVQMTQQRRTLHA
jgi:hypothetical protein